MDSEFQRKLRQIVPPMSETDQFGRRNASRSELERVLHGAPPPISKKEARRLERQARRGSERG